MSAGRFRDVDYRGYFVEDGRVRQFTVYGGKRYVHPLPAKPKKVPA